MFFEDDKRVCGGGFAFLSSFLWMVCVGGVRETSSVEKEIGIYI